MMMIASIVLLGEGGTHCFTLFESMFLNERESSYRLALAASSTQLEPN